jgi:hypothetical protein
LILLENGNVGLFRKQNLVQKEFKSFKQFKSFNPLLCPRIESGGRLSPVCTGEENTRRRFERSGAVERFERFEL